MTDTEQASAVRRGELRIYLGAAPGVGKTFAMLGATCRPRCWTSPVAPTPPNWYRRCTWRSRAGPCRPLLAIIDESTNRLTGLIDNLLGSSRLSAGAVHPRTRPVGYDEVVARALSNIDGTDRIAVDSPS